MATDKTGATTTVTKESDRFAISVDGTVAGFTETVDRDGRRTFPHTEVDDAFQGRGLASILIGEALAQTRDAGLRIVPVCSMVKAYLKEHSEFDDLVDAAGA
ncbi:MAG TPA: GNAT family N-acetyltransferase [Mycobacterium sp.]